MSVIRRVGAPTRTTKGAVGDTYKDLKARKVYKCTSAYRDSTGHVDYTWREVEEEADDDFEPEETPVEAPVEQPKQFETPKIEEVSKSYSDNKPLKNNYHKHYKR